MEQHGKMQNKRSRGEVTAPAALASLISHPEGSHALPLSKHGSLWKFHRGHGNVNHEGQMRHLECRKHIRAFMLHPIRANQQRRLRFPWAPTQSGFDLR